MENMHVQALLLVFFSIAVICLAIFLYRSFTSPLRDIPGPFIARFTKLWFFNRVRLGHFETDNIELHRKYGPVVRVSPNQYSIDDPAAIKKIYGIGTKFTKSDWYEGWKHPSPDKFTLFPDRDIKRHAETRKRFQGLYSMTSLVSYEGFADECAGIFETRLKEHAARGETINMGHWFQCYAFDVIGDITYATRFGFLDDGHDRSGLMGALSNVLVYSTLIGIYPQLHPLLFHVASKFTWSGAGGRVHLMQFAQQQIGRRRAERKARDLEKGHARARQHEGSAEPEDFLEKMLNGNEEDPNKVTAYHVFMMGMTNIVAGSDTTAVSLSAILYHLLKYPGTLRKLRAEIEDFESRGQCSNPEVTFKESQGMPYFQAVLKEALRMHAATGLPLWRVVPQGGAEISGYFFPEGSVVGVNTWCAHYNEDVFGADAKEFRPERWLEAEKGDHEKLKRMDAYYMPFGLGSRTCIGKHISMLEMSKLIPRIVRDFDFELEHPEKQWNTKNDWFVKPLDFTLKVKSISTR